MKKVLCGLLVGALLSASAPAFAEDNTAYLSRPAGYTSTTVSVRDAAKRSVAASLAQANAQASSASAAFVPRTMPRNNDGARKQMGGGGGSKAPMIIGLVTTVASIGGGYFIYKSMKKDTDAARNAQ
jgi:hypothetical protein